MLFSVIIVNFKSWKVLQRCLTSLVDLKAQPDELEVIVVDNFSNDGRFDEFTKLFPSYLFIQNNGNFGFANACNKGARQAKGEILLFLNPDTVMLPEAWAGFKNIKDQVSSDSIFTCAQVNDAGKDMKPFGQFLRLINVSGLIRPLLKLGPKIDQKVLLHNGKKIFSPDWVSGSLLMISAINLKKIGGWDEDYWMYYEDMDLCRRFRNSGGRVCLFSDFTVIHNHGGASRINPATSAITKSEVIISKHIYVQKNLKGVERILTQIYMFTESLFFVPLLFAALGCLLFFYPKLRVYSIRYGLVLKYYFSVMSTRNWISPRSVNFKR